jgi:hypothetical protein
MNGSSENGGGGGLSTDNGSCPCSRSLGGYTSGKLYGKMFD